VLEGFTSRYSDEFLERLPRRTELGNLHFAEAAEKLRVIRDIAMAYDELPPTEQSSSLNSSVTSQMNQLGGFVDQIESFSVAGDNPAGTQASLTNQVDAIRDWFLQNIKPQVTASPSETQEARRLAVEASEAASAASQAAIERGTEARAAAEQIEGLLDRLRQEAGEAGARNLSGYYKSQAETHEGSATWWLVAGAALLLMTVGLAVYLFATLRVDVKAAKTTTEWAEFLRSFVARLVVLGVLTYAVTFSFRTYRVNKHLQVANEEKRNALDTYGLFAAAATSEEARDVITAELVKAVFAPTETGYLNEPKDTTVIETQSALLGLLAKRSGG
jgi:hypothetical protein